MSIRRNVAFCIAIATSLLGPIGASAKDSAGESKVERIPQTPIGLSKVIVRLPGDADIRIAGAEIEVGLIERMRGRGFKAVGAENLVFGKDKSASAVFLVGGTIRDVRCRLRKTGMGCWLKVDWQVLHVPTDTVVYTMTSINAVLDSPLSAQSEMAKELLDGAIDHLLDRPKFREVLREGGEEGAGDDSTFPQATLARCPAGKLKLPDSAETLLSATAMVKVGQATGSAVFVTPDGFLLTAAHVAVAGKPKLVLRDGSTLTAEVVRVAKAADVALLRTKKPLAQQPCASLQTQLPPTGAEVYAAGAPAGLAFSLTRGIVSSLPSIDGERRIQTDAPINPGNSGGPLVDAYGGVLGIVSFKLTGGKVEGLGFAVPSAGALAALGLTLGEASAPELFTELSSNAKSTVGVINDEPDPVPSLDPEGDEQAAARADLRRRELERDRLTPSYVPLLKWGGAALAVVGLSVVGYSYGKYDPQTTTQTEFGSLRAINAVGWVGVGVGLGAFVTSYILRPPVPPSSSPQASSSHLDIGLGTVQWEIKF